MLPDMYYLKTLNPQLTVGDVAGRIYGLSSKWWIDKCLFSQWFLKSFSVVCT